MEDAKSALRRFLDSEALGGLMLSGVHATIAGVLAAAAIPIRREEALSPLHRLEHALAPWVGWLILPLFGFANAGVALGGLGPGALLAPLPLGIALGLFIGALAFPGHPALGEEAKVGILLGSFASAASGYLVLRFAPRSASA